MSRIDWWSLTDEALLAQCEWDRYRASGPGGQKKNKTESAVRLRHQPTGLWVTAVESRSQHDNRRRAVKRLREALALEWRQPLTHDELPDAVKEFAGAASLSMSERDPRFLPLVAGLLDLLDASQAQLSTVAGQLNVPTAQLVHLFRTTDNAWQALQRLRQKHGQKPLHS